MGLRHPAHAFGLIFLLLLLLVPKGQPIGVDDIGEADDDGNSSTADTDSQVPLITTSENAEGSEEVLAVNKLSQKIKQRAEKFNERLRRIEEAFGDGKTGTKLNDAADFNLIAMSNSHQLLQALVQLRTTLADMAQAGDGAVPPAGEEVMTTFNTALENLSKASSALHALRNLENKSKMEIFDMLDLTTSLKSNAKKVADRMKNMTTKTERDSDKAAKDRQIKQMKNTEKRHRMRMFWMSDMEQEEDMAGIQRRIGSQFEWLITSITHNPNTFVQLQKAQELLDQASTLRKAMAANTPRETTARAYNEFALRLERLADEQGPHRNLHGQFQLAEIDRIIGAIKSERKRNKPGHHQQSRKCRGRKGRCRMPMKNSETPTNVTAANGEMLMPTTEASTGLRVLDADFWVFIRQLLDDYNKLDLPQMEEVNIRVTENGYAVLSIGMLEYMGNLHRTVEKDRQDYKFESAQTGLVSVAKADDAFLKMAQNGWKIKNYSKEYRQTSIKFVWDFLCQLLDGKCPEKANLPANFVNLDKQLVKSDKMFSSVFTRHPEFLPTNENPEPVPDPYNCVLQRNHHEIQFEVDVNELVKKGKQIPMPPIVRYTVGKYGGPGQSLDDTFDMEELAVEQISPTLGQGKKRLFKAMLTAYACEGEDGHHIAQIGKLQVFDHWHLFMFIQPAKDGGGGAESTGPKPEHFLDNVDLNKNKHFRIHP